MGNRGSKSVLKFTVKEQRVDGSWSNYSKLLLRCTLMGCESSYPVKIPSKQFTKKLFSTLNTKPETGINPWVLTGFADAEGCFSIKIQQNAKLKMSNTREQARG